MERINIVGAGIIGLASAWRLAQRGAAVTIFDARDAAKEASWAGAGMLAPGGEYTEPSERALRAIHSLSLYPDFVRELEEESGVSIDFRRSGAIGVAWSDTEAAALHARASVQANFGIPSEPCTFGGRPGRFFPQDAVVDPRHITEALLVACTRRGVTVLQNAPVVNVGPNGDVWTANRHYAGTAAVVTAGAWSSQLAETTPKVTPVRGHLISWSLQPGVLDPILRHGSTYLLQRRSGVLIAGASQEHVGFDRGLDQAAVSELSKRAGELFPALAGLPPADAWNGFRPFIEGEAPFVGQIENTRVWAAYGHYRNGILLAPETAARVAAALT